MVRIGPLTRKSMIWSSLLGLASRVCSTVPEILLTCKSRVSDWVMSSSREPSRGARRLKSGTASAMESSSSFSLNQGKLSNHTGTTGASST